MHKKFKGLYFFENKISLMPFKKDIKRYKPKYFKDDIIAALSVALLTIPQSIAYSLLANLPPQAGIFAAIFGSIFTGLFGYSRYLVAGPSTGVSILIQTTIANIMYQYYPHLSGTGKEQMVFQILTQIVILIGVIQLLLGFFNLGKLLQFVSRSVILGYFAGVAIAIFVSQLFYILGITEVAKSSFVIKKTIFLFKYLNRINFSTFFVGGASIAALVFLKKKLPRFPNAIIVIVLVSGIVYFLNFYVKDEILLLKDLGMDDVPTFRLVVPLGKLKLINKLLFPSLAIALLSILEITSISKAMAAKTGHKIRSNQEIFSVGIANFILSFFYAALPASGSVSRSTVNYEHRAKTRFASVFSGIMVAGVIFFCWPLVKLIPLCALSAILFVMIPKIVEPRHVKLCFKATIGDGVVFSLTMISCLIFSLDVAFFIGIVISILFYLKRAAVPHLVEYAFDSAGRLVIISPKKLMHRKIRIIGISGELFFAAVELVQNTLQKVMKDPFVEVIILRLNGVYHVDASMCFAILRLFDYLKSTGRHLIISGVTEEVWDIFEKAGIIKQLGSDNVNLSDESKPQLSTWRACIRAKELIEE